ncbi:MAG: hypothetical protein J6J36_06725 [Clostridia bacterium]|nr:hypothetical protein [Clostridia bacterium]
MDDTTIIVYDSNEKQIERYIEQEEFENATDEEIVRDLIDIHGEDIVITRVTYDEENLPNNYETLYEADENLSYKGRLAECSQPDPLECVEDEDNVPMIYLVILNYYDSNIFDTQQTYRCTTTREKAIKLLKQVIEEEKRNSWLADYKDDEFEEYDEEEDYFDAQAGDYRTTIFIKEVEVE